jgi:hypothetical protein
MEKIMANPPMPNIPGMSDTLDFVKNLWGGMNVPGVMSPMTGPTLSTDDLEKKIADLKAVESWLNLNVTMLRSTIQALEVQRGTIATLKSMSASMAQAMGQAGADPRANPFAPFFPPAGTAAAPAQAQGAAGMQGAQLPPGISPMPAAVAWWNTLQEQFRQAVASAMSPEAMSNAAAMAQDAAARFGAAAKPPAAPAPAASTPGGNATSNASAQPGVGASKARPDKPKADKS